MMTNRGPQDIPAPQANAEDQSLLEMITANALIEVLSMAEGRERMTSNMHPMATRALFLVTEGLLTNQELLNLLRPATSSGVVGRDTKEARNLRSIGHERGLKIGDLRRHAIDLLKSGKVSQADIARAWTYAQIHYSALQTVKEFRADHAPLSLATLGVDQRLANEMLNRCYDLIRSSIKNEFEEASQALAAGRPNAEIRHFLYFATALIIDTMQASRPLLAVSQELVENVYPEIDRFYLGQDTQQTSAYLSSPPLSQK